MTVYAKWSDNADRWITWDDTTGDVEEYTPAQWQNNFGLSPKQEQYRRFGSEPGLTDEQLIERYETPSYSLNKETGKVEASYVQEIDSNYETNPALYVLGEAQDVANGRLYSRPLPAGVSQPRPA